MNGEVIFVAFAVAFIASAIKFVGHLFWGFKVPKATW